MSWLLVCFGTILMNGFLPKIIFDPLGISGSKESGVKKITKMPRDSFFLQMYGFALLMVALPVLSAPGW